MWSKTSLAITGLKIIKSKWKSCWKVYWTLVLIWVLSFIFYIAISINFRIIAMWVINKESDSIRISKQWKSATRDSATITKSQIVGVFDPVTFVILREGRKQVSQREYWLSFKIFNHILRQNPSYCESYK